MDNNFQEYFWMMSIALEEAELAYFQSEVPVGAVIVSPTGEIISKAHNEKELNSDPCGHAEIIAIRQAARETRNWRLQNVTIYVTLEPCPMCLSAMRQARIGKLVFGAFDSKSGAISLNYNLYNDSRLNHKFNVIGGIKHFECSRLLSRFFRERRERYNKNNNLLKI